MDNCLRGSHQDDFYHRPRFARDSRIALCAGCHDKLPIPLYYSELSIRTLAWYSLVLSPDDSIHRSVDGISDQLHGAAPSAPAHVIVRRRHAFIDHFGGAAL